MVFSILVSSETEKKNVEKINTGVEVRKRFEVPDDWEEDEEKSRGSIEPDDKFFTMLRTSKAWDLFIGKQFVGLEDGVEIEKFTSPALKATGLALKAI